MKKRFAALALSVVLAVGLAPTIALAADGDDLAVGNMLVTQDATSYGLWVGGVEVTSTNASNITGDGISGKITYDPATNTLTLNGANITGEGIQGELSWDDATNAFTLVGAKFSGLHEVESYYYADGDPVPYLETYDCCIYQKSDKPLVVKLVGSNKLNISNDRQMTDAFGKDGGALAFSGSGSLAVTIECNSYGCSGIRCADLAVNSGATVKVRSSAPNSSCYAVQTSGSLSVGGTLSAIATGDSDVYAVSCRKSVNVNGKLTAGATSNEDLARGVYAEHGLTVAKGANLVAEADSKGPYDGDDGTAISVYSGTFTLNGSAKATAKSCGVNGNADEGVFLKVGATGDLVASGKKGALKEISLKLTSNSLKVKAGDSSKAAKVMTASEIGEAKYVHVGIGKKANPMTVKTKAVEFSASSVKKADQSVKASKAFSVKKAQGKVTYKVTKYVTKGAKGKVSVSKNGKVTVKKGTPKGTYQLKVKVTAAGNTKYAEKSKKVTLSVTVK